MKQDINAVTDGLVSYLGLNSIDELRSLDIDENLINKVGVYLLESKEKITTSKVADLLGINRASIYNTHPKSAQYLQALIAQQKAINNQKKLSKKFKTTKKINEPTEVLSKLDKERIEKFMSVIMSLEFQKKIQEKQINNLKSTVASLQSEIREYKKLLGNE
jgi:cobalamin biosynthesis protein CbiD